MKKYLAKAYLDDYNLITVDIDRQFCGGKSERFYLCDEDRIYELTVRSHQERRNDYEYKLENISNLKIGKNYEIMCVNAYRVPLQYRFITKTARFNSEYCYDGNDLGSIVSDSGTTFKLWAPTANEVLLKVDNVIYNMARQEKGIWYYSFPNDLSNHIYTYMVNVNGNWNETSDPYGKASTPNSKASVVYKPTGVDKVTGLPLMSKNTDAIIYETSIRDFSAEGTFASFEEKIPYLKELGITHLQLMPVNDFGSVNEYAKDLFYNWGYDPVQYQCLEGSYSSNVCNPETVIADFKHLVKKLHENGIRVNLDVVFNHHYYAPRSSFDLTVPYYFIRYNEHGEASDGTFCGGEFDTEMLMCRKYFIDTVVYYVQEFDVDGYRYDLMGILDIATMTLMSSTLRSLKPNIMMYGEGWSLPTCLDYNKQATIGNHEKLPSIGFFNDYFRDNIKGSNFDAFNRGYAAGDYGLASKAVAALSCEVYLPQQQSINYVECHDDMTCFDKLKKCCGHEEKSAIVNRQRLIMGCTILAKGIPFIHAGQEFCLQKQGLANSYNAPDSINKIKEEQKRKYSDVIEYTKRLIEIRKSHDFTAEAHFNIVNDIIYYKIDNLLIIINPTEEDLDLSDNYIDTKLLLGEDKTQVKAISMLVLERE